VLYQIDLSIFAERKGQVDTDAQETSRASKCCRYRLQTGFPRIL